MEKADNGTILDWSHNVYAVGRKICSASRGDIISGTLTKNFIVSDHQGNVRNVFNYDAQQNIVLNAAYWYNPFGKQDSVVVYGTGGHRFTYNDKELDDDLGINLFYLRNRYYDPKIGRFTTPDPLLSDLNPYSYANNNPVMLVDPSGLSSDPVPGDPDYVDPNYKPRLGPDGRPLLLGKIQYEGQAGPHTRGSIFGRRLDNSNMSISVKTGKLSRTCTSMPMEVQDALSDLIDESYKAKGAVEMSQVVVDFINTLWDAANEAGLLPPQVYEQGKRELAVGNLYFDITKDDPRVATCSAEGITFTYEAFNAGELYLLQTFAHESMHRWHYLPLGNQLFAAVDYFFMSRLGGLSEPWSPPGGYRGSCSYNMTLIYATENYIKGSRLSYTDFMNGAFNDWYLDGFRGDPCPE